MQGLGWQRTRRGINWQPRPPKLQISSQSLDRDVYMGILLPISTSRHIIKYLYGKTGAPTPFQSFLHFHDGDKIKRRSNYCLTIYLGTKLARFVFPGLKWCQRWFHHLLAGLKRSMQPKALINLHTPRVMPVPSARRLRKPRVRFRVRNSGS